MEAEKRCFGGWFIWVFVLLIFAGITIGALSYLGIFTKTVVERKIFENSYQRSEALKSQIANDEAVLAEIRQKLTNPNLDENTRHNLAAQASAAKIRLSTARRKQ